MSSASRMSKRLGVAGALRRCLGNANLRRTTRSAAASFFEQPDHLGEHVGGRRFHALAPVVLLGSQPGVLALNGDAQNPVIAEIRLEVAHLVLEGGTVAVLFVAEDVGCFGMDVVFFIVVELVVGFAADVVVLPVADVAVRLAAHVVVVLVAGLAGDVGALVRSPLCDLLGDGSGQERDGPAVEAGLDALLQVVRELLLVTLGLVAVAMLARAAIGPLPAVALEARPVGGRGLLVRHCCSSVASSPQPAPGI